MPINNPEFHLLAGLFSPKIEKLEINSPGIEYSKEFSEIGILVFQCRQSSSEIIYSFTQGEVIKPNGSYMILPKDTQYYVSNLDRWSGKIYFASTMPCVIEFESWNAR